MILLSVRSRLTKSQAACSLDGYVRTYEAMDVTNLAHWTLSVSEQTEERVRKTGRIRGAEGSGLVYCLESVTS